MSELIVGIDDTDMPETPGTNRLALHLVRTLGSEGDGAYEGHLILRHQLLYDPRVPCTKSNGCASIRLRSREGGGGAVESLAGRIRALMGAWCPTGSDPGLCVCPAFAVTESVRAFGVRCQRELVSQGEARALAAEQGIYLEGLGGDQGGVIGALAAIGLASTGDDGRVIYLESARDGEEDFEAGGLLTVAQVYARGVAEICPVVAQATHPRQDDFIDVGKRLRPNLRGGKVVLFVEPAPPGEPQSAWRAVRLP